MYLSQASVNVHGEWVFAAEHAPGGPYRVLERRDGLAEIGIVERHGGAVFVERPRVIPPQPERCSLPSPRTRRATSTVLRNSDLASSKRRRLILRDLSLAVRAPHREAALKAAESLRGPDCPSHNLDEAGENPRYGWSVG